RFHNILLLIDNDGRVAHTRQVIAEVVGVQSAMTDAETGQRGFLLTGQEKLLEPYDAAVAGVHGRLDRLRGLTADNPVQQDNLKDLTGRIDRRLALLAENIRSRREQAGRVGDAAE